MGRRGRPYRRIHQKHPSPAPLKTALQTPAAGPKAKDWLVLALFWGLVLLPLAWGVSATVQKAWLLFK